MLALVILEAVAIGLLGLLVAGLLRSHAEILRRLHHLDAGPLRPPPAAVGTPVTVRQGRAAGGRTIGPLTGETPTGEVASIALDRDGERTLLLFLSSGCGTCQPWWDGLTSGAHHRSLPGVRVIVVAQDATHESPSLLGGLGPADVTVLLSSAAWDDFAVPGSPFAVLIDGSSGEVMGSGVAQSWSQLASLVGQHLGDVDGREAAPRPDAAHLGGAGRERRADAELLAAGIHPGHPSLNPIPGAWTGGKG